MTKAQLAQRVAELEASQTPRMPAHIVAHQAGANARAKAIDLGRKTRTGAVITTSCITGFFSGLFGK